MEIKVGSYTNITQEQFRATAGERFVCWSSTLTGKSQCIGGVDAMMKKDLKAIVSAYKRLVKKRGYNEFLPGKYQIRVSDGSYSKPVEIKIAFEVK
jgi:hypothetical protein